MRFFWLCSVSALALFSFIGAGTARADPKGLWQAQDGAKVRISSCGRDLCGTIASPKSRVDPDTGQPWTDKHNPDPAKRGRPLAGLQVFSMAPDGAGKWSGRLYNADNGQTYPGHLVEVDPNTVRVEGCVLFMCGGRNMSRIQ